MPGSTGSTSKQSVVPVGINPARWQCLVLRVFVLVVVPVDGSVVPVLIGGTGESPVIPVGQIPAELIFAVNCTSGSTGGWFGSTGLDRWYR
jgi:hypothetical protein